MVRNGASEAPGGLCAEGTREMNGTAVREAEPADLTLVQEIYALHVRTGLASFELDAPDLAEIERRFQAVRGHGLPFLVADLEGRVAGFAYAAPYRARPAYRHTLENSVYVAPLAGRRGLGSALLTELIRRAEALGYRRMIAVVGDSGNEASIGFHLRHGFKNAGTLPSVGFKFGRWVDSVLLERSLGEGDKTLP